jgi:hypothetical protein
MNWCKDIGDWFRENVEKPLLEFFQDLYKSCEDASHWLEDVTQRIEQQCRQQECNWWCLCCNKWFCWLVTLILRAIRWIVDILCKLILTILVWIIWILVQIVKWVILAVVCLFAALCSFLFLIAGIALIAVLLCLVALAAPTFAPIAAPVLPIALTVAVVALVLAKLLCEASRCRLLGVIAWALKWSITLGAVLSIVALSPLSALVVVVMGGCLAALMVMMERMGCRVPNMIGVP